MTGLERRIIRQSWRSLIATALGALSGALALGVGLYVASVVDRLMVFYALGALAGGLTGLLHSIVGSDREPGRRALLGSIVGASVVLAGTLARPIAFSIGLGIKVSFCWGVAAFVALRFLRRLPLKSKDFTSE